VIHVRVRQKQQVDRRQLSRPEGRGNEPPGPELGVAATDSDSGLECRVGEEPHAKKIGEDCCMAEPGECGLVVGPPLGVRALWGGANAASAFLFLATGVDHFASRRSCHEFLVTSEMPDALT
jgi:hypothetical protein